MTLELDRLNEEYPNRPPRSSDGAGEIAARALSALRQLNALDAFVIAALPLLTVVLAPGFFEVMDPRRALVLAGLPLGIWLLARRVVDRDSASLAALAFLIVAFGGALASGSRWPTVAFGSTGSTRELSGLSLLAAFGWWAAGRRLSDQGRTALPIALTVAAALNVLVGVVQLVFLPTAGLYSAFSGRMSGLMSNPVYFASTFVGVWAYWLVRAGRRCAWLPCLITGSLAISVALSGSRGAIAVGVLISLVCLAVRPRRSTFIASGVSIAGFVAGLGALGLISRSQPSRIGDVDSGLSARLSVWRAAMRAWRARPITGWGPDPYQKATSTHFTADEIREQGTVFLWPDPHNVVIYLLVSVGVLGVVLLATFVVLALRGQVNWPLLVASVAIALSWMLQPVMINGWPIAFALFGASVRPFRHVGQSESEPSRLVCLALMSLGVALGLVFLAWSIGLRSALDAGDADLAEARASWLIRDPTVAMKVAGTHLSSATEGDVRDRHLARAEKLATAAAPRSGDPRHWTFLAEVQLTQRDFEAAFETELHVIDEYPTYPLAYELLRLTSKVLGDKESERFAIERLCDFGSPSCAEWLDGG